MDFTHEIARFTTEAIGGIYIAHAQTHEIVFADAFVEREYGPALAGKNALEVLPWEPRILQLNLSRDRAVEWEYVDQGRQTYWRLNHWLFDKDGDTYQAGQMTDTTEYMLLSRDVAEYSVFFEKLSAFQSAMLERISSSHSALFPVIAGFFKSPRLHFLLGRSPHLEITTYDRRADACENNRIPFSQELECAFPIAPSAEFKPGGLPEPLRSLLLAQDGGERPPHTLLCSGTFSDQRYAVVLEMDPSANPDALGLGILQSIVALCVENSLMREAILYESEHDKLTGLYNKGKYLARLANEYPHLDSVALFNFDVNGLKQINDRHGHEAGDKLLMKAADSIRKVASEHVHGYRMGGDEYLMIACNCRASDVDVLKERWTRALEELNQKEDGIHCVMALGTAFARKNYDFAELMKIADARMYEDKRRLKKPGEEIR